MSGGIETAKPRVEVLLQHGAFRVVLDEKSREWGLLNPITGRAVFNSELHKVLGVLVPLAEAIFRRDAGMSANAPLTLPGEKRRDKIVS